MTSKVYVLIQFSLIIAIAYAGSVFGGLVQNIIFALGLSLGLWAIAVMKFNVNIFPDVRDSQKLYTGGPYKYVRHPMYSAVLISTLAWVLNDLNPVTVLLWLLLFIVLYKKLSYEEIQLKNKFPLYEKYTQTTKKLIPFIF